MDIRILTAAELDEAIVLAKEIILSETDVSWSKEAANSISEFMTERLNQFTVYGLYAKGLESILVYDSDKMHIILLLTKQASRKKGYATALLNHLKEEADENHLSKISANVVASAVDFYHHFGFEDTGISTEAGGMNYTPMEYLLGREWLGKTVTVIIDHPYGSFHPHIADLTYPVNTGYVEELFQKNDEFQDAYVIGPKEPLDTFKGVVSGIIYHKDDHRSYFIVTRVAENIDENEIIQAVGFEQQFYETRILWK